MHRQQALKSIATVGVLITVLTSSITLAAPPQEKKGPNSSVVQAVPSIFLKNNYLQVLSASGGRFVIGLIQGDPATPADDNRRLLYGYPSQVGSSFSTLQISHASITNNYVLGTADPPDPSGIPPIASPLSDGTTLTTRWQQDQVDVAEQLSFAQDAETRLPDTVAIAYTITNTSSVELRVGLRILLDLGIGTNDAAPIVIERAGERITQEAEWQGRAVPERWSAFESTMFSLQVHGQLSGGDATSPDRFVFADWDDAKLSAWDYTIEPTKEVDDSALLLYYAPLLLAPGQTTTYRTYVRSSIGRQYVYLPLLTH